MTSKERVMAALEFGQPDCVPLFDSYWPEWTQMWRAAAPGREQTSPEDHYGVDIKIAVGDESLAPSRAETLEQTDDYTVRRDGWGRIMRTVPDGYFYQQIENGLEDPAGLDGLQFDPPHMPERYAGLDAAMPGLKDRYCVFAKVGGPFIRTYFVRGEVNYLMDMAGDPAFAKELTMRIADHLIAIGIEELRRWDLYDTGIWIFDDMASNQGPVFSPATADEVLVPAWAKMVDSFKAAGARKVIMHSDGNIGPLLDRFVELGFDGINPVEPKAGLNALKLREKYGSKLALLGGICNASILPLGNDRQLREHVLEVLAAGREGGLVIGTHSIGPDISVRQYEQFFRLLSQYGGYPLKQ